MIHYKNTNKYNENKKTQKENIIRLSNPKSIIEKKLKIVNL